MKVATVAKRVHVIINPAAGRNEPILNTLNNVFKPHDIDWAVTVTHDSGDAARGTQEALAKNVDAVAVYGGDGSLVEAAGVLHGSDTPLLILPGGTANAFAQEMRIPQHLEKSAALLVDETAIVQQVDLGYVNEQPFLVGTGTGIIAQLLTGANREQKDRLGYFAYSLSALQSLVDPEPNTYQLEIDGELIEISGVGCYVANCGNFGLAGVSLLPPVKAADGLLDLVIFRKADLAELTALAAGMAAAAVSKAADAFSTPLPHWQAKSIQIKSSTPTAVAYDGEPFADTPVSVRIAEQALRVITPVAPTTPPLVPGFIAPS